MNIRTKDLNLLVILATIGEELNLSRASRRLGLSQPAMSHALARLRRQFGDPLFVRGPRGLIATPKVSELLPQVRDVISAATNLYNPSEKLDLAKMSRSVVIASTAYFEARTAATFVKHIQAKAPGLRIETRSLSGGFPKRELETGEFDIAIAAYFDELPNSFKIRTVFRDRFVCVSSKSHPYVKSKQTTKHYLDAKHMQIEVPPSVFAPVDEYLQHKKKHRDIWLRIGNFLTPPVILNQSEYLLTCPLSLAETYREMYPLIITELPFRLAEVETKMVWHEKDQHDPFHAWLRGCLA